MIRIDSKEAAQRWVEEQRRISDAQLDETRLSRNLLLWMIRMAPILYPGTSVLN